jgi:hypothetical protein
MDMRCDGFLQRKPSFPLMTHLSSVQVSLSVRALAETFGKSTSQITSAITLTLLFRSLGAVRILPPTRPQSAHTITVHFRHALR